jgi:hypothetical protein
MAMRVERNHEKKVLFAELDGFPAADAAKHVLEGFDKAVSDINPKEYSLLIDCMKLGVFKPESVPVLENLFQLYIAKGFRKIVFVNPSNAVSSMQLRRVARNVSGFTGQFADTLEQAWSICKA